MYAGIDVGTTSVKLIVFDWEGNIVFRQSQELPISSPKPGWYEQNPEDWWAAVKVLLSKLAKTKIEPKIIGLTGQMHSLVLVDKAGNVLRPAILWNDQRCYLETKILTDQLGGEKVVIERLGNPILTGFTAPKLLWVKNNEPEVYKKASTFMLPKDFIAWKLTGKICTEPSDASGTSLFNVKENKWDEEALKVFSDSHIQPPQVVPSQAVVGEVVGGVTREIGFKTRPLVVAGGADNACAALGMNAFIENVMVISVGTSGTVILTNKSYVPDLTGRVHTFRHVINDMFYHMGVVLSATFSLDWFARLVNNQDVGSLIEELENTKPCHNGIFFLPYLSGERTPHKNPDARGVFFGLSGNTDRKALTRAILEGVGFALRDCRDAIQDLVSTPKVAKITGGGSRSELWIKIIASILNVKLERLTKNEGASTGAAMLAGMADGAPIEKWNQVESTFLPVEEWTKVYEEGIKYYRELYSSLKELMSTTRKLE
ncbi:xylulokinase [Pseudothermotoga thermarum]|uniref:Xylulose kinase n=1 Tax=Pseudothermotoga thermarum DSM 5069 TaxID=688269 RepID=F7YUS4_9THEM|nr:xylulokinase [Pseudothermotoga thermarum]AEH50261.1 xylulokinase [Pseudothermotoga thermarum DSM 5069]